MDRDLRLLLEVHPGESLRSIGLFGNASTIQRSLLRQRPIKYGGRYQTCLMVA